MDGRGPNPRFIAPVALAVERSPASRNEAFVSDSSKDIHEPLGKGLRVIFEVDEVIVEGRSDFQHMMVAETPAYGRALFLDRLIQSAESDEMLYHEPLIHPAMVIHGGPKRVLVAGAGEGASMRELLRHPSVESILAVDLDRVVIEACREHLPAWHAGSFDDPRVELRFEDIQDTLAKAEAGSFDAVILDITDPVEAGPSVDLFTVRFYREVARVLADDGVVVLQAGELDLQDLDSSRTVRSTLGAVFPWVHFMQTYVPSFHSLWALALAGKRAFELVPEELEARVAAIGPGLRMYDADSHRALVHTPKFMREALEQPGTIVTGDDDERLTTFDIGDDADPSAAGSR